MSGPDKSSKHWRDVLALGVQDVESLLSIAGVHRGDLDFEVDMQSALPIKVPRRFTAKIERGNPRDPLLLQVLPSPPSEKQGFSSDPLHELPLESALLRKYHGRALLIATGACAIHCQYCFRREFPYSKHLGGKGRLDKAFEEILSDASITEVILSGGDPLMLSDMQLLKLIRRLEDVEHLKRIRLHTRLPVVLPERLTAELVAGFQTLRKRLVVCLHVNHPRELDEGLSEPIKVLQGSSVAIFNQSVLLKGVNDSCEVLSDLSERLFEFGVVPYYLHLLDRVRGSERFEVDEARARRLYAELAARVPGYLLPRLVREEAGLPYKRAISCLVNSEE